jgi:drug/metabolite transporter (DMT)-like permease
MSTALSVEDRRDTIDTVATLLMLLLTFSWALNGVAAKLSNAGFSPVFVSLARSALGGLVVYGWCLYRKIPIFERDGTLWPGLLVGFLFAVEFTLIFFGLDYTSVARGTLLVNTMPFWVLVGAHFLLGERMSLRAVFGLALAFAGVVIVFSDKLSLPGPTAIWGDMMCLVAGLVWAATTIAIKRTKVVTASPEKILLYQLAVSAVMNIPLLPLAAPVVREVSTLAVGALLFQAFYVVAFTYILWFWLMRRYPAAALSSFAFLTPAFGVLLGGLLLDEPLGPRIFMALALIAAGLIIVNRPPRRPREA